MSPQSDSDYYTGLNARPNFAGRDGTRFGTTAEWTLCGSIIPEAGAECRDITVGAVRIGDGVTTYANLPSSAAPAAIDGGTP